MSWLSTLQVRDLGEADRLEVTCRSCGTMRWITRGELMDRNAGHLWLDEVQARTRCRKYGCGGSVRLALTHMRLTSGFTGGIA